MKELNPWFFRRLLTFIALFIGFALSFYAVKCAAPYQFYYACFGFMGLVAFSYLIGAEIKTIIEAVKAVGVTVKQIEESIHDDGT